MSSKGRPGRDTNAKGSLPLTEKRNLNKGGKPCLNAGGNEGNRYGGGRKPNVVRKALLEQFDESIPFLLDVRNGTLKIPTYDLSGEPIGYREPSIKERLEAIKVFAEYGLGKKMDVTTGDEPIKMFVNVDDSKM